jgi:hypothetical protein
MFLSSYLDPDLWIHPNDSVVVTLNAGEIVVSDAFSAGITLRFPRITKVRKDADSKDPSNIESEENLREKYWDVQNSRSNASVGSSSIQLGSPDRIRQATPCRFLTEKQYQESLRHRKSTSRKTKQLKFVPIPEAEAVSTILNGISFSVLGGTGYTLVDGTIEFDEAKEYGWYNEAHEFTEAKSIIMFIKKHGGKYKISVDNDCTFVLGGNINDSKVVTYVRAIEHARLQLATFSHKATSKKGQEMASIARSEGVLRWTFAVSLVYRWLSMNHTTHQSIIETDPDFIKPSIFDYLVRPSPPIHENGIVQGIDNALYESNISTVSKMRRALELIGKSLQRPSDNSGKKVHSKTWRDICMEKLNKSERWIASCKVQTLWSYSKNSTMPSIPIIIYPDIFSNGYGNILECDISDEITQSRWDDHIEPDLANDLIMSVLPLLRVMGAFITTDLHIGVTHILCNLIDPVLHDEIIYHERIDASIFVDQPKGTKLLQRLNEVYGEKGLNFGKVTLISPHWVRKRKWYT